MNYFDFLACSNQSNIVQNISCRHRCLKNVQHSQKLWSSLVVNCGFCYKQQDDLDKILSFSLSLLKRENYVGKKNTNVAHIQDQKKLRGSCISWEVQPENLILHDFNCCQLLVVQRGAVAAKCCCIPTATFFSPKKTVILCFDINFGFGNWFIAGDKP